jgi:sRNA-binding carbon storage regulator CsrA
MLFEQNSQSIYTDLSKKALIHSAQEGKKYNIATQQAYTTNMLEHAKQHTDDYKDPQGNFQKYMTSARNSIYQQAELEGVDKNDPIVDTWVRKLKTDAYTTVLNRLFADGDLEEGRALINILERKSTVSHDTIQKFESDYNKAIFTKNVDYLEDIFTSAVFDVRDVTGIDGPAEKISLHKVTKVIEKQLSELGDYSPKEVKVFKKRITQKIKQSNQIANEITQGRLRDARIEISQQEGQKSIDRLSAHTRKYLTQKQLEELLIGSPEKSVPGIVLYLEKHIEFMDEASLELFRPYVTKKFFLDYSKRVIALNKKSEKEKYTVSKEIIADTIRSMGVTNILNPHNSSSAEKYDWLKIQVQETLRQQKKLFKRELTIDEERKAVQDILRYTVTREQDNDSWYSPLVNAVRNVFSRPSPEVLLKNSQKLEKEKQQILYTGEDYKDLKKGDYVPLDTLGRGILAYYHAILIQEGDQPTLRNILVRYVKDLKKAETEKKPEGYNGL